jgi:hypothetical protein
MRKGLWLVGLVVITTALWRLIKEPETCQQIANQSCFNQRVIDPADDWSNYSFVVLGHLRSGPTGPVPNRNLQENVQRLFVDDPAFVFALGDLYYSITEARLAEIKLWVSQNIPVPFFNAVGNHDTLTEPESLPDGSVTLAGQDTKRYAREFGDPNYDFTLGSEMFIFLENGSTPVLGEDQSRHLKNLLPRAAKDSSIKNIFLMTHQVFWSYYNPAMEPVFRYRHPVTLPENYRFFLDELKPLLESMPEEKQIFLLAGDIGGGGKYLQTFFLRDGRITYIATGMGNKKRDSFITVSVKNGEVSLKNTNFMTGEVSSLNDYGLDYWINFYRDNPKFAAAADQTGEVE